MNLLRLASCIAPILLAAGCGGGDGSPPPTTTPTPVPTPTPTPTPTPLAVPYPAGLTEQHVIVNGVDRQFLIHVPARLTQIRALIVVLHGGTGSGAQASNLTISPQAVFRTVADRESAIAVFPTGLDNNWNDCRGDAPALAGTGDDIAFFDALLTRLQGELGIDARRVFMTGTSNGALMSMRYAFERSERVAAIAISSGNLPAAPKAGRCETGPTQRVPILMTHGALDPLMPPAGGCVAAPITTGCSQGTVISADATRDRWLGYDGLTGVAPLVTRVEVDANDGGQAMQYRYVGAIPVERWVLEGAGHSPPSRTVFLDRNNAGQQNRDIEFAEVAWTFFVARLP